MLELAAKLYNLAADMDVADCEEAEETDIFAIVADLEKLPQNSTLLRCLGIIADQF